MADFILNLRTDSGSVNFPKFDQIQLPAGTNIERVVSGSEWNSVCQALVDTRKNILSGSLFGFGIRYASTASMTPPKDVTLSTLDFLYVKTDGSLMQHKRDGTEFTIAAAVTASQYTHYTELDTQSPAVVLPALTQGSGIIYFRSNGQQTAGLRRTQFVIRWGTDNSDTVIAEGPLY